MILSLFAASSIMTGERQTYEESLQWQSGHYDTSFYSAVEKNDYKVEGQDGYILHVEYLKCPEASDRYVIITHGYTDNMMGSLKYARMYLELGYNCIIYDIRGHGANEPTFTTYGILEAQDLMKLIEDTRLRYPEISVLGLHGESLGAATTVTSMKYGPDVDYAVADCGFEDIENVLRGGFSETPFTGFIFRLADFGAKLRYHYSLSAARPVDSLDDNTIPLMFIHGTDDSLIPPQNSQDMFDRTKGRKEIHFISGAEHAMSAVVSPDEYKEYLADFLMSIDQ